MSFRSTIKRLTVAVFSALILLNVSLPAFAQADDYKITVKTTFEGNPVEGIDLKLSGNSVNKTETTGLSDTVFTDLAAGSYTVTIIFGEEADFELSANSSGAQTIELTPSNQSGTLVFFLRKKEPPVDENLQSIQNIKLPANLTKVGSTTTDFSKLTADNIGAVQNFTFDNPGVNKITYLSKLDLSNFEDFSKITLINDYLDLEQVGKVRFDTALLRVFDKPARITMGKMRLVPLNEDKAVAKVMKDGATFELENASYSNNLLSFDVEGFSTYTVAPRIEIDYSELIKVEDTKDEYQNETDTYKLMLQVDNLDAQVTLFNNGEIVNIPAEPANDGKITGDVKLVNGNNRIKIEVKLANGEKIEEFYSVKYQPTTGSANDVSRLFGIAFFCLILLAGIGLGVYYLKVKRQITTRKPGAQFNRPKPQYNSNLMTEEEKRIYGDDSTIKPNMETEPLKTAESTEAASKASIVSNAHENSPIESRDSETPQARKLSIDSTKADKDNIEPSPIVIDKNSDN